MALSLPPQAVRMDAATLAAYRGSFAATAEPLGIARPRNATELMQLVQWARQRKVPLSPYSSVPDGNAFRHCNRVASLYVDMSQMNRVIAVDRRDRVAVIEAGVTFQQLDAALAAHGMRSYKPLQPRANKSVLACYLDREPILQAREHWDVLDPIGAGEIVFGTGEAFRTGSASGEQSPADMWNAGVRFLTAMGPGAVDFMRVVQGSQGTLGVVPWAAVLCEPIPQCSATFFITGDQLGNLTALVARLQRRKMGMAMCVFNRLQLASLLAPRSDIPVLAAQLPEWVLYVELAASAELPQEQIAYETEDLQEEVASLGLQLHSSLAGQAADKLAAAQGTFPAMSYKTRVSGACEDVFFLTTLDKVAHFAELAQQLAAARHWPSHEIAMYVQPRLQGRNCHVEFILPVAAELADKRIAAQRFAAELSEACARAGGFFSRPYGTWHRLAQTANPGIVDYLHKTKQLFDPDGILNPGRFDASHHSV